MRIFLKHLALALSVYCLSVPVYAARPRQELAVATTKGAWQASASASAQKLEYVAKVFLLDKANTIALDFYCDTTETKNEHGALGFDLHIGDIAVLKPFDFDAFEGPDASTAEKKLLRTTLYSQGKVVQTLEFSPSGFITAPGSFDFGVSAVTAEANSDAKALLRALANGADILMISVTDPNDATRKLEFPVSVTGKGEQFKTLLKGAN